ncbi:protein of unknown function DUF35 [Shewanella halifaxensis HAW-EB4]|uniref:DNA-binding protein n=1 Tax=Shewanella halifaxensis (strain HAW-EB4) TaxID=458817 RepID=B0TTV1_SHEHH|nr:OB-fold domain-containing protein [Shewanella halifaxensis]ABZ76669.1 protein of unknown function DUF35 [Shewanella halifaxensis HAW-EB4]
MADYPWMTQIRKLVGTEYDRIYAWDAINPAMVRQWCEVMGIDNPLYTDEEYALRTEFEGIVAPPSMLQSWCLAGFNDVCAPGSSEENPYGVLRLLEAQGYPAVVAVNSDLDFKRYLKMGEKLCYTTKLDSISEEKTTGLGVGYFVTFIMTYLSTHPNGEEELVGTLLFRVFKFKPAVRAKSNLEENAESKPAAMVYKRPKPGISDDNRFFWDGCNEHELRIQHCTACDKLQHPPAPICMHCQSFELDHKVVSGKGEIFSFVVMHYPEVPPFEHPNPIGLIELDEGVRLTAGLVGLEPEEVVIGQKVEVEFTTYDGDLTLPMFKLVTE